MSAEIKQQSHWFHSECGALRASAIPSSTPAAEELLTWQAAVEDPPHHGRPWLQTVVWPTLARIPLQGERGPGPSLTPRSSPSALPRATQRQSWGLSFSLPKDQSQCVYPAAW